MRSSESYTRALKIAVRAFVRSCPETGATPAEVARALKANGPAVLKAMQDARREGDLDFDPKDQRVGQAVWRPSSNNESRTDTMKSFRSASGIG